MMRCQAYLNDTFHKHFCQSFPHNSRSMVGFCWLHVAHIRTLVNIALWHLLSNFTSARALIPCYSSSTSYILAPVKLSNILPPHFSLQPLLSNITSAYPTPPLPRTLIPFYLLISPRNISYPTYLPHISLCSTCYPT